MLLNLCRHIRTSGLQCKGIALSGSPFCYFHDRLHARHIPYRFSAAAKGYLMPGQHIELGPLEDRESVQVAISQVVNALATRSLEVKRATALLYGLQLASANAAGLHLTPRPLEAVRDPCSTPDKNDAPAIDLAPPGAVYEIEFDERTKLPESPSSLSRAELAPPPSPTLPAPPPAPDCPSAPHVNVLSIAPKSKVLED